VVNIQSSVSPTVTRAIIDEILKKVARYFQETVKFICEILKLPWKCNRTHRNLVQSKEIPWRWKKNMLKNADIGY